MYKFTPEYLESLHFNSSILIKLEIAREVNSLGNSWNAAEMDDRDVQVKKRVETEFMT